MTIDYDGIVPEMRYFICRYCTSNWSMPESTIDFVDLTYVFEGSVTYIVNGVPYHAEKGDLICIPSRSKRQAEIDPDRPMAAYAANLWLYHLTGRDVSLPFPIHSKIGLRDDLLTLYKELNLEWMQKKPGSSMRVRAIMLSILHKYFRLIWYRDTADHADLHVSKVLRYIHENYHLRLEVKELARLVDLNPSYFGTLFKKHTGSAVKEYINKVRVNNAENMLVSGEFSITETAYRCGFEDVFYFSKVFKKVKGYSPSRVKMVW
ncbi:AraC family transcriptional regulator [Cohnella lubricantis]|uniref:Helix-turn-helix transcriptional regulator n=1 Tax=Cohnella lubricantis TaxID=2163172 RepID=A0A841T6Y8_9BACL|nr:AraC family transcriptional regulator [Cohnella lubricantis]MBB6675879.1 helix-turn-helix transcriptional regulator [Cohnella lubricantis]MBP2117204.1 AraC-like DNA-binding protein [Cohnella lubricantis]